MSSATPLPEFSLESIESDTGRFEKLLNPSLITLRCYQYDAVDKIREAIRSGYKNILVCAPTGAGKTILAAFMVSESDKKNKKSAFVVDRINLIDQTSEVLDKYGIDHGVIQADHWRYKPHKNVQICSIHTISGRGWPEADVVFHDECHTVYSATKQKLQKRDCINIGLTATPFTKGLGLIYDCLINVTTTNWLIEEGFLAKYRVFAHQEPDMSGVKVTSKGEWDDKEASKQALAVVGNCVAEYINHGENRKFICSAVDTTHAEELQRQFSVAGIVTAKYTYQEGADECADIVQEFKKEDSYIRGLITVTKASKGFDVPDIGCVIMARPLRNSLSEHIQLLGRGLRSHPSKEDCIVLDHSGNCARFWSAMQEFFEDGALELCNGKKKAEKKQKTDEEDKMVKCSHCRHLHKPMPFCPNCGHEYPKKQAVVHVPGTLKELVATGNKDMISRELFPQIVYVAKLKKQDPAAAEKYALAIYRKITGMWPKGDFKTTEGIEPTRDVVGKIRQLDIAFIKARGKSA